MFDTNLAIVGNVLTAPEWRRLKDSGSLVANFRVASTARRFDREKAQWVDGNSLRVRVTAWRRLAEGVASSIAVGDPVVVYGRLYNRDWQDEQGNNRTSYEMEAFSIGHDLARGRAKFFRTRLAQMTSEIESSEAASFVRGEQSVPLTADEAPVVYGDGLPDQLSEDEPSFVDVAPGAVPAAPSGAPQPTAGTRASAERAQAGREVLGSAGDVEPAAEAPDAAAETRRPAAETPEAAAETREAAAETPEVAAESGEESPSETDDLTLEVERLVAEQQPASNRRRRSAKREPVGV
ncbi:MAG TPA: single-stranded DNA-binding protein [Actinoplanes sp.]